MSNEFENRIALVTGGGTGIGAAVALELARGGADVVITGRTEATLRSSAERHPRIKYVVADIGAPGGAEKGVNDVRARWDGAGDGARDGAGALRTVRSGAGAGSVTAGCGFGSATNA